MMHLRMSGLAAVLVMVLGASGALAADGEKLSFSYAERWKVCNSSTCSAFATTPRTVEVQVMVDPATGLMGGKWTQDFRDPATGEIYRGLVLITPSTSDNGAYSMEVTVSTVGRLGADPARSVKTRTSRWRYLNFVELWGAKTYYDWGRKSVDFGLEIGPVVR